MTGFYARWAIMVGGIILLAITCCIVNKLVWDRNRSHSRDGEKWDVVGSR
jgi:hypothetical protein